MPWSATGVGIVSSYTRQPNSLVSGTTSVWDRAVNKFTIGAGCWEWIGAKDHAGYGYIRGGRRGIPNLRAPRFIYESLVGAIPKGLELDHLCHNRACVNPDH